MEKKQKNILSLVKYPRKLGSLVDRLCEDAEKTTSIIEIEVSNFDLNQALVIAKALGAEGAAGRLGEAICLNELKLTTLCPAKSGKRTDLEPVAAGATGYSKFQLTKIRTAYRKGKGENYVSKEYIKAKCKEMRLEGIIPTRQMFLKLKEKPHLSQNTTNPEWYSPASVVEPARATMGGIDLDPASCELANEIVKADKYYTKQDNGLLKEWTGRVWMNPPYDRGLIDQFVSHLINQMSNISQAVVITHNSLETDWAHKLLDNANAICHIKRRVQFYGKEKAKGAALQGQTIFGFKVDVDKFVKEFDVIGSCWWRS